MSNDINMKFSLESQEDLSFKSGSLLSDDDFKFNSLNPYQYTDKEVKIKSISANGTPLEPDADKNVDIPDAKVGQSGLLSATNYVFLRQLRNVSTYGSAFAINPIYVTPLIEPNGEWPLLLENNMVYILDNTIECPAIYLTLIDFCSVNNDNGHPGEGAMYMANAEIIFETKDVAPVFSYDSSLKFVGLDVEDGVFVPQPNMKYDIVISWYQRNNDANILMGYVSGYEVV